MVKSKAKKGKRIDLRRLARYQISQCWEAMEEGVLVEQAFACLGPQVRFTDLELLQSTMAEDLVEINLFREHCPACAAVTDRYAKQACCQRHMARIDEMGANIEALALGMLRFSPAWLRTATPKTILGLMAGA